MRASAIAVVVMGCGGTHPEPPGGSSGAAIEARCGALVVRAEALAGGMIRLRYAAPDAPARRSWSVVAPPALDPDATIGADGGLRTAAWTVALDAACRASVARADGAVVLDDAEPAAIGATGARLVRAGHGDPVYGLGERTGGLDRRGRAWTFWNTDAYDPAHGGWAPDRDPLYQSIPLEVRLRDGHAHGVFTDETRRMVFDLVDPAREVIAADGARSLDQYVIAGPRMADVLDRYTALTGRPALPPRWALGFHQSRWGYTDGAELEAIAARFRAEGIPADALWLDIQHLRGFRTFTVDETRFPPGLEARLATSGFRTIAIADPGLKVEPGWDVYDGAVEHALRRADGAPYHGTAWPGPSIFPDLSRASTRAWWGAHIARVAARGVAGIWLDVNEPTTFPEGGGGSTLPDDLVADGDGEPTTMAALHNAYALFQARATYEALGDHPFVLSRAGCAGIQRYAAVWTGDVPSTWDGLAQTLPMLLGLGLSGVPIVGSDIGGYSGHATPELYARWLALGSISPFARAHVTSGVPGQEPWMFGDEVTALARARLADRYRLLPYLYSLADEAARTGAPILRPLVWEFPDDPAVRDLGDQAMLGPYVLAAPIAIAGATSRRVYLPAGRWYELHSGAIFDGPATITASATMAALPLYVREGAILPVEGGVELYPSSTPSDFTLVEETSRTAISMSALSDGARVTIDGAAQPLVLRIHRVDGGVVGVDGATSFAYDADARVLSATVATSHAELRFRYDPAIAELRPPVPVTFEVHVPADTPASPSIHVAISALGWTHVPLAWVAPGVARGTVTVPRGDWFDYKFTRGTWDTVEKLPGCGEAANRYRFGAAGAQTDRVAQWRDRCP